MRDEINTKVEYIRPLTNLLMTIGELPTSYLMSLTYEEQLLWFYNFLNQKIIPVINTSSKAVKELQELFVLLQKYVNDYFDNLDVQEEINNKIDEMVEDGTLEGLIKGILSVCSGDLTCNIEYRDGNNFIKGVTNETTPLKGYMQGFTTTPNSYIICRKVESSMENADDTMVFLQEISKSTKQLIREAYLKLYHANSIAYNDEDKELYVASTNYTDEGGLHYINDIIVVDYNTFTIKDIIEPTEVTATNRIRSVSYDNKNKVLAYADEFDVFIMEDLTTIKDHIILDTTNSAPNQNPINNTQTIQNIVVYNNKIYACRYNCNGINIFDMNGKLLNNYYSFDIDIPVRYSSSNG